MKKVLIKIKQQYQGFTLIESLIYFGMLGILLLTLGTILFQVLFAKAKAEMIQEVGQGGRIALERIADQIRNAQSVSSPTLGQSSQSLTLTMSDGAKNPTIIDVAGGQLRIKEGALSPVPITSDELTVGQVLFTNASHTSTSAIVKIDATLSASTTSLLRSFTHQESFSTSVTTRPR